MIPEVYTSFVQTVDCTVPAVVLHVKALLIFKKLIWPNIFPYWFISFIPIILIFPNNHEELPECNSISYLDTFFALSFHIMSLHAIVRPFFSRHATIVSSLILLKSPKFVLSRMSGRLSLLFLLSASFFSTCRRYWMDCLGLNSARLWSPFAFRKFLELSTSCFMQVLGSSCLQTRYMLWTMQKIVRRAS